MLGLTEQEQDPQHTQEYQQEKQHESLWARFDSALAAEYCELRESLGDLVALLKAYHAAALYSHTRQYADAIDTQHMN